MSLSDLDQNISFEHYKIHDGEMYEASVYTSITNSSTETIAVCTGDKTVHLTWGVAAGGAMKIQVREGITLTAGTTMTTYNLKRSSSKLPEACLIWAITWSTTTETLLYSEYIAGGTTGPSRAGGISERLAEIILAKNTKYLFSFTNVSGGTVDKSTSIIFYEV